MKRTGRVGASAAALPARGTAGARAAARRATPLRLTLQGQNAFVAVPTRSTLRRWVLLALADAGGPAAAATTAQITLRFVGGREGRTLNRRYRGRDHATNVLTFDYQRPPAVMADIVLCVPVICREARAQGKTVRAHLAHLVLHGLLHALGHDHQKPAPARAMEAREVALLARLRLPDPYRT